jgi:leader peptidase (prepilin peptidase) / N-methyltransferase
LSAGIPVWLVATFTVLLGLAFGSFLNVCIARLPCHQSIVRPRSRCPRCGAPIRALDNLPILSWILLRGRCRHCHQPIAWRYPAVELATAALFLLSFLRFGLTVGGVGVAVLCFLLFGLAVMDAETLRLPDAFTLPGIVLGIVFSGLGEAFSAGDFHHGFLTRMMFSAILAASAALLLLLIRWLYFFLRHREGLGMGDVKLLAMIAAWLGPLPTFLTLLLACLAAGIFGLVSIALSRGRRSPGTMRLPFGSFLCAAAIYVVFAGDPILRWYLHFYGLA